MKPYYEREGITIYLGDCFELLPGMPKVDLVLTDPPYGIRRLMRGGENTGHWKQLSSGLAGPAWERPDIGPLFECSTDQIIWGGNYFQLPPSRCWLVWRKLNAVPTQADIELAWTSLDACARMFDVPSGGAYFREHPTQKPLNLMKWCLGLAEVYATAPAHCPTGRATVIDPFMGSGTTLRAAKDLGYRAIGIEIDERYCEIAARRLSQSVLDFGNEIADKGVLTS